MKQLTKFTESEIGRSKCSQIIPLIALVGSEWGLKINRLKDFKLAKKILINSAKNN